MPGLGIRLRARVLLCSRRSHAQKTGGHLGLSFHTYILNNSVSDSVEGDPIDLTVQVVTHSRNFSFLAPFMSRLINRSSADLGSIVTSIAYGICESEAIAEEQCSPLVVS